MGKKDSKQGVLNINHTEYVTRVSESYQNRKPYKPADKGNMMSFIPGTVIELLVKEGDMVLKGDDVMVLEAMKMKNRLKSPVKGMIKKIRVSAGDKVPKGTLLMEIDEGKE